jgi:hypothetical protein
MLLLTIVIIIISLSLLLGILHFGKPEVLSLTIYPKTVKEGEPLTISLKLKGFFISKVSAWIISPNNSRIPITLENVNGLYRGTWIATRPFEIYQINIEVDGPFTNITRSEYIRVVENRGSQLISVLLDVDDQAARLKEKRDFFPVYIREILRHAGFPYETIDKTSLSSNISCKILILPYNTSFLPQEREKITEFVSSGGILIGIGGSSGLEEIFGVRSLGETLNEGYIKVVDKNHPITSNLTSSLHVFGEIPLYSVVNEGVEVLAEIANSTGIKIGKPAIIVNRYFEGLAILLVPDLISSIVRIQQGKSVTCDGPWPVNDGILKTDDGAILDYTIDREEVSSHKVFLHPIADEEREIILKSILYAAWDKGIPLPFLWYWPGETMAVALYSHDSDGGDEIKANLLLSNLSSLGVRSTWCILHGEGYSKSFYEKLKAGGYEIALHYNALPPKYSWSKEGFIAQYNAVSAETGTRLISNKNHYLRWEFWTDFYRWCEEKGIELDQSKGPSKAHNLGFLFGTSHPYFPIDDWSNRNRFLNVLEVALHDQEMWRGWPDNEVIEVLNSFTYQSYKHYGVVHHLFHPAHIQITHQILKATVEFTKSLNHMSIWTAREINEWERKRREVSFQSIALSKNSLAFQIFSPKEVEDATIMLLIPRNLELKRNWLLKIDGEKASFNFTQVYGFNVMKFTRKVEGSIHVELYFASITDES